MKTLYVLLACMVFLGGCGLMDLATGLKKDKDGNIIASDPNGGAAGTIAGTLIATGGVTGIVGTALGWLTRAYRHKRVVDSGKRDDDFDGVPDDQGRPTPT